MDAEAVFSLDGIFVDVRGQAENGHRQDQERGEDRGLQETIAGNGFGPVAKLRTESPVEDDPEDEDAVEEVNPGETRMKAAKVASFAIEVGR